MSSTVPALAMPRSPDIGPLHAISARSPSMSRSHTRLGLKAFFVSLGTASSRNDSRSTGQVQVNVGNFLDELLGRHFL